MLIRILMDLSLFFSLTLPICLEKEIVEKDVDKNWLFYIILIYNQTEFWQLNFCESMALVLGDKKDNNNYDTVRALKND